jgi:putative DNA primase/helicase
MPPADVDFDDMLRGKEGSEREAALVSIAQCVAAAPAADVAIAELEAMMKAHATAPAIAELEAMMKAHEPRAGVSRRVRILLPRSRCRPRPRPQLRAMNPAASQAPASSASVVPFPARTSQKSAPSQTGGSAEADGSKGAGRKAGTGRGAGAGNGGRRDDDDGAMLDRRLAFFPLTDLGNAERFRERNRGRLIWCAAIGWFWWDGRRWSREGADERVKIAEHECVRSSRRGDEIAGTDADVFIGTRVPARRSRSRFSDLLREVGALLGKQFQAGADLAARRRLPCDPAGAARRRSMAINVLNGTLFVGRCSRATSTSAAQSGDFITKLAPVTYDPDAPRERFDLFMDEVQPNKTSQRTLQQWAGYALTGDVGEQKLAVFYGTGKNGKSVFEDVTSFVAGDYSESVPIETFLAEGRGRNAGQATPDLAILPGVRKLRTSEPKKGAQLDEALIKLATGGEPILGAISTATTSSSIRRSS